MGSRKSQEISYICLQQDILVTSQGILFLRTRFLVSGGGPWQERCLETKRILAYCGVFVPGKRFIWNKMGRAKGFVPIKTFSRDQMPQTEGFVPRERVSGTKSSRVSPFPEGRDLGRG